ncbi:MAG: Fic family protein [Candidatus Azobacteroides sp.]|nr:Fic family protein [Candidatus Azobacteroides sp.]
MKGKKESWKSIEELIALYKKFNIDNTVDHDKFYLYSIIAHSTAIEGSTLTELDTQLLLDEDIVAKGKSFSYHLMTKDLKDAYVFALRKARDKTPVTPEFLMELNAFVMKSTGSMMNTINGNFDSSKGEFRLCGVTAGMSGQSYLNFRKVPESVSRLCEELNIRLKEVDGIEDIYNLSFDAHLNLVTIHPWLDGNGRTSRLLMNYIQAYKDLILSKVYKEDRDNYIKSLNQAVDEGTNIPFREFMTGQLLKTLKKEIDNYKKNQDKGMTFMF